MSAATIILARERRLVNRFRAAGATSPTQARTLADLDAETGLALRRLTSRAVVREAAPGLYYLDEPTWSAVRRMRLRVVAVVAALGLALAAGFGFGVLKI